MKILPEPVIFEWDKWNIDKNFIKHKETIKETEQLFADETSIIFEDEKHSRIEIRYALFGVTEQGRKLSVVFTLRKDKIRVITVRDMSKKERRSYEKIKTNTRI